MHGWSRRGVLRVAKAPQGHWKTMTFLAALRYDEITAPLVLDGPINGESFLAYVEQVLAPTLKRGNIVVMDNLGSHKGAAIDKAIRAKDALRHFPPQYFPDLNPIEQVFEKLEKLLRKADKRTPEGVWRTIGSLLDRFPSTFTPDETTLPRTRSAKKAVLPKRPKGMRPKPARVVSLNSIAVTKSWIARMKKLRRTMSEAMRRIAIWIAFSKNEI
jgi:transposase